MEHDIMELNYGIRVSFVANTVVIQILSWYSHSIPHYVIQYKAVEGAGKQQSDTIALVHDITSPI